MILIYLDESGINYKVEDGLFVDGPFLIFGAMCVNEDVYWSMERLFCCLIDDYFKIDNWIASEIHATDLWAGKSISAPIPAEKRRQFFDEFLQLCGKFEIPYIYSFTPKLDSRTIEEQRGTLKRCGNSSINSL